MERYYYHGIELYLDSEVSSLEQIIKIIKSGELKTRNSLDGSTNEGMNHICLYRKNEEFDYENRKPFPLSPMSALDAWINYGLVFVISPDINAYKPTFKKAPKRENNETNIIDEWRIDENIPLEKVVGIALPLQIIEEELKENQDSSKKLYEKLNKILAIAKEYGWFVVSSEEKDFTDKLDEQLNKQKTSISLNNE